MENDLFKDFKRQPKIYAIDIEILAKIPIKGKEFYNKTINLERYPMIMHDGNIATEKQKQELFKTVFDRSIHKSSFDKIKFEIISMKNPIFLSKLSYKFDYNND